MSNEILCPICINVINGEIDRMTTLCGHTFHASCLTKNIIRNGANCPCCRKNFMSEQPEETEETGETEEHEEGVDEHDGFYDDMPEHMSDFIQENTTYFQDISGIEQEDDDIDTEDYEEWIRNPEARRNLFTVPPIDENDPVPSVDFIVRKLTERGYNMTDFVRAHLVDYAEYSHLANYFEVVNSEIVQHVGYIIRQYEMENGGLQVNRVERTDIPPADRNVTVRRVLQY